VNAAVAVESTHRVGIILIRICIENVVAAHIAVTVIVKVTPIAVL